MYGVVYVYHIRLYKWVLQIHKYTHTSAWFCPKKSSNKTLSAGSLVKMRYQICFNDNDSTMEFYVHVNAHIYLFIHSPTDFLLHGSLTSHQRNISFAVSPYIYLLRYVCTCMFLCACAISSLGKNHKHEVGTTFTLKTFVIARITTCSTLHRYTFCQGQVCPFWNIMYIR